MENLAKPRYKSLALLTVITTVNFLVSKNIPWLGKFFLFVCLFVFFIKVKLTYSVVLVSGIGQSESVMQIHISIPFQILFPYRLLYNIE